MIKKRVRSIVFLLCGKIVKKLNRGLGIEPRCYEHSYFLVSRSLKNETDPYKHSSFPVSSSLKHETIVSPIASSLSLELVPEPSFHQPVLVDPLSSSLSGEHFLLVTRSLLWYRNW
jgi:hypothetical protein